MLCWESRTCFEVELYKVLLNKTFRTNFSSLLVKEIKQHALLGIEEYEWKYEQHFIRSRTFMF